MCTSTCFLASLCECVYVSALWSLAQMTLGNCFLSCGLSVPIIVTKGGVSESDLFHLPMAPLPLFNDHYE